MFERNLGNEDHGELCGNSKEIQFGYMIMLWPNNTSSYHSVIRKWWLKVNRCQSGN